MVFQVFSKKGDPKFSFGLFCKNLFISIFLKALKSKKENILLLLLLYIVAVQNILAQNLPISFFNSDTDFLIEYVPSRGITFDVVEDSIGFIWAATQYGLLRYDGNDVKSYEYEPGNDFSLSENSLNNIALAPNGKLWLSLIDNGLHMFDTWDNKFTKFKHLPQDSTSLAANNIQSLLTDSLGNLWVATASRGLDKSSPFSNIIQHYFNPDNPEGAYSATINDLYLDDQGQIWIASINGFSVYNPSEESFRHFHNKNKEADYQKRNDFVAIEKIGNGFLLATNDDHLYWFDLEKENFVEFVFKNQETGVTIPGKIWDLFLDNKNRMWVAKEGGLFLITDHIQLGNDQNILLAKCIRKSNWALKVYQSADGTIWAGFSNGLYKLLEDLDKFKAKRFPIMIKGQLYKPEVASFTSHGKNTFWIGTTRGIYLYDKSTDSLYQDIFDKPNLTFLKSVTILTLFEDSKSNLWISTISGFNTSFSIYKLNLKSWDIHEIDVENFPLKKNFTSSITEDASGKIWLSNSRGLISYTPENDTFKVYQNDPKNSNSLPENKVLKVYNDKKNRIWIGMESKGIAYYQPASDNFIHCYDTANTWFKYVHDITDDNTNGIWIGSKAGLYHYDDQGNLTGWTKKDGLPDNSVCSVNTDTIGNIWAGTDNGFIKLEPVWENGKISKEQSKIKNFLKKEGYLNNDFWYRSSHRDTDGNLYFGNGAGLTYFNPNTFNISNKAPKVILTDFTLFNKLQEPGNSVIPKAISILSELSLKYNQNVFSIKYSALEHKLNEKVNYAYMMEGFDETWQVVGKQKEAYYTNLSPGNYTFKVKATDSLGEWPQKFTSIQLIISPPWWKTWWAYLLYASAISVVLYALYRFKLKRKLEIAENHRVRELDNFKSRFYTNITHEFRTPLTIINGISSQLIELNNQQIIDFGKLIKKNSNYLLVLINQLLDLSKVHSRMLSLDIVQADVIIFLKTLLEPFKYSIQEKDLIFEFKQHPSSLFMDFDRERLHQIVDNLLSNAIKFTNSGSIKVWVETKQEEATHFFYLNVEDTGLGIPQEEQEKIFDNFYQIDASSTRKYGGSGIGLALTKELVLLMGGELFVASEEGKGSLFSIKIPITNKAELFNITPDPLEKVLVDNHSLNKEIEEKDIISEEKKPILLIIEDNKDLRIYLQMIFKQQYHVIRCNDGLEGIKKALNIIPDIILCDIMLPSVDGFEVCRQLKQDIKTSHVPFIFLTAKVSVKDRIKGLNLGADAYLHKPFSKDELMVTIDKCISLRYKLRARYASLTAFLPSDDKATQANDNFIIKLKNIIEKHLLNTNLNASLIADEMSMSRSQLHRKLKNITGKSLTRYIRYYRLGMAKQLLENSEKSISEVSFEVGFNDPNYFSRMFYEEFGERPSLVRNTN